MPESAYQLSFAILVFGGLVVGAILVRNGLRVIGVPPLVGFIAMGLLAGLADDRWPYLNTTLTHQLQLLAELGIFALLFRVGLESDLRGLIAQLPRAALIWIVNVVVSGVAGYLVARELLALPLLPSLFVGVALTATSIGVTIAVWQELGALRSKNGALFMDAAELDDLSAVILMVILFAVLPHLDGAVVRDDEVVLGIAGKAAGWAVLKVALFGAACFLFSRYAERPISRLMSRFELAPDPMLMVVGIGVIIAAIAGLLGFSLAIGALFAGLVFSRDPEAVKVDASFGAIHEMFVPFFFIGIGLMVEWDTLELGLMLGGALLAIAVASKVVGAGVPALWTSGVAGAAIIGVSMVPRAEIAMLIMREGHEVGDWAVPDALFSAMLFVSLVTCLFAPIALRALLRRWPQRDEAAPGGR